MIPTARVWAPDLSKVGDTFYIYYPSDGGIHVITSKNPRGPWTRPVDLQLSHRWTDPGHVVGPDGKRYLGLSKGYLVQLADDGLSVVGQPRRIYEGWPVPWDPNRFVGEGQCLEGPKFFRRGDYYYFVSAENGTAGPPTSHMLVVSRSKSLEGPWENCPANPIVHTRSSEEPWWSRGHGTIFDTPEGRWYVVYHAYKAGFHTLGRFTLIEPIIWTEDGWPALPKTRDVSDPVLATEIPFPAEFVDDFKDPHLRMDWQYYGAARPDMKLWISAIVGPDTARLMGAFYGSLPATKPSDEGAETAATGSDAAGKRRSARGGARTAAPLDARLGTPQPGSMSAGPKKVAVLKGGGSLERTVSLRSGARAQSALRQLGHEVVAIDVGPDLVAQLLETQPDAAFIALHGSDGEDGTVQGLLEAIGILDTGSGPAACMRCTDKALAKYLMREAGIPTPEFVAFKESAIKELGVAAALPSLERSIGFPLVAKPASQGSALGVKFARAPPRSCRRRSWGRFPTTARS